MLNVVCPVEMSIQPAAKLVPLHANSYLEKYFKVVTKPTYQNHESMVQCILDYPYLDYPNLDYPNTKLGRKQGSIPSFFRRIFKTDEVFFLLNFEFC